jgi:ABC-type sulfate transport system permease component
MNYKSYIAVALCLSIISLLCLSSSLSYACQLPDETIQKNVITESDAGGGKVTTGELLLVSFIAGVIWAVIGIIMAYIFEGHL